MVVTLIFFVLTVIHGCKATTAVDNWFDEINEELIGFNRQLADVTWKGMLGEETGPGYQMALNKTVWTEQRCKEALKIPWRALNSRQERMTYLLCRGPRHTPSTIQATLRLTGILSSHYESTKICITRDRCLRAEPDLDELMRKSTNPEERLAAWQGLRDTIGPPSRRIFKALIDVENQAARAAGYHDIGECWREELEMPGLRRIVEDLYEQVVPLYRKLHAFVRFRLGQYYGQRLVPMDEPIPAHLLGNMGSSSWDNLITIMTGPGQKLDLDSAIRRMFPTVKSMLKSSEDYYASLGLPMMTQKFWDKSIYDSNSSQQPLTCHGTAANMYKPGDVRMLTCAQVSWEDFYEVHHEMGHIHYFMAYENQPGIFQDAANSAVQETIGDTIWISAVSPKHLQRSGIIRNVTAETEMTLMLVLALNKIPQLAYGLILDKWRWDVMESKVTEDAYNELWWKYRHRYQGVRPPVPRYLNNLDPMAKFHVADNTPYIRYFLSGYLQFQLLDVMCGEVLEKDEPLHKCDLYGSKAAGFRLRSLMKKGLEKPWNEALTEFSNGKYTTITAEPLLKYFAPLQNYLSQEIRKLGIPVGW